MTNNFMQFNRQSMLNNSLEQLGTIWDRRNRSLLVAIILAMALFAFEIFNFDTTKFALYDLLGSTSFWGISWAAILAFAFCAIDFAGLVRIFTPEQGQNEPKEVWYLTGAWLLGATMNAVMTWYAVSILLAQRTDLGTEVLTREDLLTYVPIFVAVLVWLTRILFIGSLSVAGEQLMATTREQQQPQADPRPARRPQNNNNGGRGRSNTRPQKRPAGGNRGYGNPQPMNAAPARPIGNTQPIRAAEYRERTQPIRAQAPAPASAPPIDEPRSRISRRPSGPMNYR